MMGLWMVLVFVLGFALSRSFYKVEIDALEFVNASQKREINMLLECMGPPADDPEPWR